MADSIKISTQVLIDTAKDIRSYNDKLSNDLTEINKKMDGLGDTWKSEAATDIRSAMDALKPRFEEYKGVVESYAKFLEHTAQSYESTEQTNRNNASQFK